MKASLLVPPKWYFKEVAGGACFSSKEEIIGEQGKFSTGLTIYRYKNVSFNGGKLGPIGFVRQCCEHSGEK